MRDLRNLALVALGVLALCSAAAPAAVADLGWHTDSSRGDIATGPFDCNTGLIDGHGYWTVIPDIQSARALFDQAAPPPVGDIAWIRVAWAAGLGDSCQQAGGTTHVSIEVIPPDGTHLATDEPFHCAIGFAPDGGFTCPVGPAPGDYGGTKLLDARGGQPVMWPLPSTSSELHLFIPLRVDRALNAFGSTADKVCHRHRPPAASLGHGGRPAEREQRRGGRSMACR